MLLNRLRLCWKDTGRATFLLVHARTGPLGPGSCPEVLIQAFILRCRVFKKMQLGRKSVNYHRTMRYVWLVLDKILQIHTKF